MELEKERKNEIQEEGGEERGEKWRETKREEEEINHIFSIKLSVRNLFNTDHHGEGAHTLKFFLELNSTQKK